MSHWVTIGLNIHTLSSFPPVRFGEPHLPSDTQKPSNCSNKAPLDKKLLKRLILVVESGKI